ncbi:MAG: HAMP domain-containing histidine kinase [Chitinophagaceae bacterium]|nr:MAG: HAMP domain-containing histidine kinase [Chitinophagaceae bacterium]
MDTSKSYDQLVARIEELEAQVSESHDIIDAIRKGEVDAFIVKNEELHELYTLKSADKSYRVFIEQMSEGALTVNEEDVVLYSNQRFATLISIPLHEVIGLNLVGFMPASVKVGLRQLIDASWKNGQAKGEISLPGNGPRPLPLLFSINRIQLEGSQVLSIIVTDLSLQKESQHQKRVMEKKDEFISIASHELKTPVTSIKGYVQLLRYNFETDGNTVAADMLGKVDAQINKLTSLIGDLLDVKKIENGQLQYKESFFDFNELVIETAEETQRVIHNHHILLELVHTRNVYGDRNKIGQVITNFIDNAAKYSPAGSNIVVSSQINTTGITLSVQDFGIGIPLDQQAKVFERFFRVNGEKENTYAGLGLGLYISSEIIKRHKGKLTVKSVPGDGSVFSFELPFSH